MQAVVKHDDQQQCEDLEAALALALDEDEASTCSVEASEAARQPREDLQAGMKENDDMNVRVKHSFSMSSVFGVLPDDILCRLLIYAGTIRGKVSKRWERIKILVVRERHVNVLLEKTNLPEGLCREVEGELYAAAQHRITSFEYKNTLRKLLFHLKESISEDDTTKGNPLIRQRLLSGELLPFHLVRLAPEEFLRDDEKALREKAGEEAHKRMSLSAEEVQAQAGRLLSRAYQCRHCHNNRCWVRRWRRKPQVDRYRLLITCDSCGDSWDE
ncbi:hypothetical protein VYU27_009698 [Nannochloropsis oceanica]